MHGQALLLDQEFVTISLFERHVQISTKIVVYFLSTFYRMLTYTSDTCVQNCYTRVGRYNIPQKICSVPSHFLGMAKPSRGLFQSHGMENGGYKL